MEAIDEHSLLTPHEMPPQKKSEKRRSVFGTGRLVRIVSGNTIVIDQTNRAHYLTPLFDFWNKSADHAAELYRQSNAGEDLEFWKKAYDKTIDNRNMVLQMTDWKAEDTPEEKNELLEDFWKLTVVYNATTGIRVKAQMLKKEEEARMFNHHQNTLCFLKYFWYEVIYISKEKNMISSADGFWKKLQNEATLKLAGVEELINHRGHFDVFYNINIVKQLTTTIETAQKMKKFVSPEIQALLETPPVPPIKNGTPSSVESIEESNNSTRSYSPKMLPSFKRVWIDMIEIAKKQAPMNYGVDQKFWRGIEDEGVARLEQVDELVKESHGLSVLDDRIMILEQWTAAMELPECSPPSTRMDSTNNLNRGDNAVIERNYDEHSVNEQNLPSNDGPLLVPLESELEGVFNDGPATEQQEIDRVKVLASFEAKNMATTNPQENSASTNVPILMPKSLEPEENFVVNPTGTASEEDIEKVFEQLTEMVKEKKGVTLVPTKMDEQDYEAMSLTDLRKQFDYPFHRSDGMYWPVLHTMPENSVRSHVEALAQCNSFSGKFASHLLLTATPTETDYKKKFDDDYMDCDGEWADYAKKPGRFSNREGFRAKQRQSKETFEVQRKRAVAKNREQFAKENEAYDRMYKSRQEYDKNRDQEAMKSQLSVHFGQLVRDSRLDEYSIKTSYEFARTVHPGTRDTHLDPRWHNHGYRFDMHTRNKAYCQFMNKVCANYEHMLPKLASNPEKFEEWCLTPMLASLYYQAFHKGFNMFPKEVMKKLKDRRRKYLAVVKSEQFVLKDVHDVCRLTEADKQQWTILLDQLVAHFKDFPPVSALIYDRDCSLYDVALAAINELMSGEFKGYSNMWDVHK